MTILTVVFTWFTALALVEGSSNTPFTPWAN